MAIPKKLHYCWFGKKEKNDLAQRCISSWKKYCPEYEIIEWNEDNYDVYCNEYCSQMYENKKWAFLTDYVRLDVIYKYGGIYLDTDVELIKSLDSLLNLFAFVGLEENAYINTGLGFGAEPQNELIFENMRYYETLSRPIKTVKCPEVTTSIFKKYGFTPSKQIMQIQKITIFPSEYFSPKDYYTEKINITSNTYSIHHYAMSWCRSETARQRFMRRHPVINYIFHTPNRIGIFILGDKYEVLKKMIRGNEDVDEKNNSKDST